MTNQSTVVECVGFSKAKTTPPGEEMENVPLLISANAVVSNLGMKIVSLRTLKKLEKNG